MNTYQIMKRLAKCEQWHLKIHHVPRMTTFSDVTRKMYEYFPLSAFYTCLIFIMESGFISGGIESKQIIYSKMCFQRLYPASKGIDRSIFMSASSVSNVTINHTFIMKLCNCVKSKLTTVKIILLEFHL